MFGIPFSRPFTNPFGVPFLGGQGGTPTPPQPPFPSGFSEYWNAYDETLIDTVTGISIDAWTGTSVVPQILTQATEANRPTLIENANIYQNRVRKTATQYMDDYPVQTGDQSHVIRSDYEIASGVANHPVTSANLNGTNAYVRLADDIINDTEEFTFFGYFKSPVYGSDTLYMENSSSNGSSKIDIAPNASTLRVRVRLSSGSNTYFTPVPNLPLPINQWNFVSVTYKKDDKVEFGCNGTYSSDDTIPTLATGDSPGVIGAAIGAYAYLTGDLGELDASIGFVGLSGHTALTQAELESIRGTDINKAKSLGSYPQAIRDKLTNFYNVGTFTGSPSATEDQIGSNDGTYVGGVTQVDDGLTVDVEASGALMKDLSHSSLPSYVGVNSSNQFELTADSGTVFTFATTTADTENRSKAWVIRGTNLEFWLDAILIETKDFTGETLTLDQYGAPTDSSTGDTEYLVPYPSALSQSDIEYFSYERDSETNEILLPPQLPSASNALPANLPITL